jgi:hypothetical protein
MRSQVASFSHSDLPRGVATRPNEARDSIASGAAGYHAITILGVLGFVGLLSASYYLPGWATDLRVAALAWFAALGGARTIILRGR